MQTENTFIATIYVGVRESYTDKLHTYEEAKQICMDYCDTAVSPCVTITETEYVYKYNSEKGFAIGLINYPRFPALPEQMTRKAIGLAMIFLKKFKQNRISIVCSDKTYMLEANIK